jgi:hypothetical protein
VFIIVNKSSAEARLAPGFSSLTPTRFSYMFYWNIGKQKECRPAWPNPKRHLTEKRRERKIRILLKKK